MCELLAVSSKQTVTVNDYIREVVSHSTVHPHGWGMAIFYGSGVSLEKEPVPAYKSGYLKERLQHQIQVKNMMVHIRLATHGTTEYENCHPFVRRDHTDRAWTLMHNGTIFECSALEVYRQVQEGQTDSERILCHIVHEINLKTAQKGCELNARERFAVVDHVILEITPNNNKVNLILYDGEQFYVHTNMRNTLYMKRMGQTLFFATVPLDQSGWNPVPFMQLLAFRDGEQLYCGTKHQNEYFYDDEAMKMVFLEYAML